MGLVYGIGINDGKYPTKINKRHTREYQYWSGMMARCFSKPTQQNQKTYIRCSVSDNFLSYSYFHEWCQNQVGFGFDGFDMDKDLIFKGNAVYGEDSCLFLPRDVNRALCKNDLGRGELPIGVCFDKRTLLFTSYLREGMIQKHLGRFNSEIEAHLAYKSRKEAYLKELAEKWKSSIDARAYNALINYKVEITD